MTPEELRAARCSPPVTIFAVPGAPRLPARFRRMSRRRAKKAILVWLRKELSGSLDCLFLRRPTATASDVSATANSCFDIMMPTSSHAFVITHTARQSSTPEEILADIHATMAMLKRDGGCWL